MLLHCVSFMKRKLDLRKRASHQAREKRKPSIMKIIIEFTCNIGYQWKISEHSEPEFKFLPKKT